MGSEKEGKKRVIINYRQAKISLNSKDCSVSRLPTMPSAMPPPAKKSHKDDKSATHKLALKGSSKTITEFFDFACNTILFQRGVYPPEDFTTVKKYGLPMMTSCDDQVKAYIKKIM